MVGLITPWNFPAAIPVWKLAPALIYGNTIVLKLAQDSPLTGLHIVRALEDAGLPAGRPERGIGRGRAVGTPLVEHPGVRAISFTGSVPVGEGIRETAGRLGKRVQLELGGHNPLIVMADADLGARRRGGLRGRVLVGGPEVHGDAADLRAGRRYDAFRDAFLARVERGKVGDPSDPDTEVGPLVNESAMDDVLGAIERGRSEGGSVLAGGERGDDEALTWSRRPSSRTSPTTRIALVRGGVRPGDLALPLRGSGRGARAGERGRVRPLGGAVHRRASPRRSSSSTGSRRASSTSTPRPPAPTSTSLRRRQGLRLRPARAGPRGARVLHRGRDRLPGRWTA